MTEKPVEDDFEPVYPTEFSQQLSELLGIQNMTYCCLVFDWENNRPVRANVEFILNGKKVRKMMDLLKNCKSEETRL